MILSRQQKPCESTARPACCSTRGSHGGSCPCTERASQGWQHPPCPRDLSQIAQLPRAAHGVRSLRSWCPPIPDRANKLLSTPSSSHRLAESKGFTFLGWEPLSGAPRREGPGPARCPRRCEAEPPSPQLCPWHRACSAPQPSQLVSRAPRGGSAGIYY